MAQTRDFHGYLQVRDHAKEPWQFIVTGFDGTVTGEEGTCTVARIDGPEQEISIDAKDRILVRGKRYGRDRWNH